MIHKLIFQKISQENPIAGVGTAGNIWIVANALLNIKEKDSLYIDMETNKTINNEKEKIFNTYNAWEYYFDQANVENNVNINSLDFYTLKPFIHYNRYYTHDSKIFNEIKKRFFNNFKLKDYLKKEIEEFYQENLSGKITLGVQIRLTDMTSNHNVKKFHSYIDRIKKILIQNSDINQVFLATDDETIIQEFQTKISVPVVYLKDIYRATKEKLDLNPYDRCDYIRENHLFLLGKEVILDIFLLSKCDYILKSEISAVSQLSCLFSENIKKTFFMKSKFINDLKFTFLVFKSKLKSLISK